MNVPLQCQRKVRKSGVHELKRGLLKDRVYFYIWSNRFMHLHILAHFEKLSFFESAILNLQKNAWVAVVRMGQTLRITLVSSPKQYLRKGMHHSVTIVQYNELTLESSQKQFSQNGIHFIQYLVAFILHFFIPE